MTNTIKPTILYICLAIIYLLFSSIAHAESSTPTYTDTFRIALSQVPLTLDPQKGTSRGSQTISQYIYDPLFTLENGDAIPVLIESYQWKKPHLWHFTLKQGVHFHDGSELTTKDVVATFNRAFRLKNRSYEHIKHYTLTARDTYSFQIETQQPNSELLWDLEDILIIKHSAEYFDSEAFNNINQLVGTGPYQLVKQKNLKSFEFKAFKNYHRGAAYLQHVVVNIEPDEHQRISDFIADKVDLIGSIPNRPLPNLQKQANITNITSHVLYFIQLGIHLDKTSEITSIDGEPLPKNPLKDLRVRQAISKALDREALTRLLSIAQPASQLVNDQNKFYDPIIKLEKQDIAQAKQLLSDAGYPNGFRIILRDKQARESWLEPIATMLKAIGIHAQIKALPAKDFFDKLKAREFSAPSYAYTSDGNLTNMLKQLLYTQAKFNTGGYSNPKFDQQIDFAMSQTSSVLKKRELKKAQRLALKDLAIIPIGFLSKNWAIKPNFTFNPTDQSYTEAYYVHHANKITRE